MLWHVDSIISVKLCVSLVGAHWGNVYTQQKQQGVRQTGLVKLWFGRSDCRVLYVSNLDLCVNLGPISYALMGDYLGQGSV